MPPVRLDVQDADAFASDEHARLALHDDHVAWVIANELDGAEPEDAGQFTLLPGLPEGLKLWRKDGAVVVGPAAREEDGAEPAPGEVIGVTVWVGEGRTHSSAAQLIVKLPAA